MKIHLTEVQFAKTQNPRVGQVIYRIIGEDKRLEVLLVRSFTPGYDIGYCLSKGKRNDNETDEEGSAREVLEETGLRTKVVADLGSTPYHHTYMHIFLSKYESGALDLEGNALDHDYENDVVRFFDWDWALQNIRPTYKHWLDKALPKIKEIEMADILIKESVKGWIPPDRPYLKEGGQGSGNFGHSGRPGQVGGSGAGGIESEPPIMFAAKDDVTFEELLGEHYLSGFDTGVSEYKYSKDEDYTREGNSADFVIDSKTYTVIEDEMDGYRSRVGMFRSNKTLSNTFKPIRVMGVLQNPYLPPNARVNVIDFIDVRTGKVVLSVGTDSWNDEWYPKAIQNWYPQNMSLNQGRSSDRKY